MKRRRTLLALVAIILGVVVLQDPAGADRADTVGSESVTTTTTEATAPLSEPAEDDAGRGLWIAAGMVIAAAALGGLIVLPRH